MVSVGPCVCRPHAGVDLVLHCRINLIRKNGSQAKEPELKHPLPGTGVNENDTGSNAGTLQKEERRRILIISQYRRTARRPNPILLSKLVKQHQ